MLLLALSRGPQHLCRNVDEAEIHAAQACECTGDKQNTVAALGLRNFSEPWGTGTYGSSCMRAWDSGEAWCLPNGTDHGESWCQNEWCYVRDGTLCPHAFPSKFVDDTNLYYSYETCGAANTFDEVGGDGGGSGGGGGSLLTSPCLGGAIAGIDGSGYCKDGHTGPKCEACVNSTRWLNDDGECVVCPGEGDALRFTLLAGGITVGVLLLLIAGWWLYTHPPNECCRVMSRCIASVVRKLRALGLIGKFKILVAFLQIWMNIPAFYGIDVPKELSRWFDVFRIIPFNFDLDAFGYPTACLGSLSSRLQLTALLPLGLVGALYLLGLIWAIVQELTTTPTTTTATKSRTSSPKPGGGRGDHGKGGGANTQKSETGGETTSSGDALPAPPPPPASLSTAAGKDHRLLDWRRALTVTHLAVTPLALFVVFCAYPAVSLSIFETWLCDPFEASPSRTRSFLRLSIGIECQTSEWEGLRSLAVGLIFLWPLAMPLLFFTLLSYAREAIKRGKPHFTDVLASEYKPEYWWWECLDLVRRARGSSHGALCMHHCAGVQGSARCSPCGVCLTVWRATGAAPLPQRPPHRALPRRPARDPP